MHGNLCQERVWTVAARRKHIRHCQHPPRPLPNLRSYRQNIVTTRLVHVVCRGGWGSPVVWPVPVGKWLGAAICQLPEHQPFEGDLVAARAAAISLGGKLWPSQIARPCLPQPRLGFCRRLKNGGDSSVSAEDSNIPGSEPVIRLQQGVGDSVRPSTILQPER